MEHGPGRFGLTQQTRYLHDDGKVKEERIERYDPSLPDSERWRLIAIDGRPASAEQRLKWEKKKNGKTRKHGVKPPGEYLDLERAKLLDETPTEARFEIVLRPEVARLLAVDKIAVVITVDKESGNMTRMEASLRQPIAVLLGLARITELDLDVRLEPAAEDPVRPAGEVQSGSTASVTISKLGDPIDYHWTDFKRVTSYGSPKKTN
ncbi:MAG: hypothetical protein ABIQ12_02250 [Opitutaceae bacterium]